MTVFALQQYSVSPLLNAQMHLVRQSTYCSLHARVAGRGKTDGLCALLKCFWRSSLFKKIKIQGEVKYQRAVLLVLSDLLNVGFLSALVKEELIKELLFKVEEKVM